MDKTVFLHSLFYSILCKAGKKCCESRERKEKMGGWACRMWREEEEQWQLAVRPFLSPSPIQPTWVERMSSGSLASSNDESQGLLIAHSFSLVVFSTGPYKSFFSVDCHIAKGFSVQQWPRLFKWRIALCSPFLSDRPSLLLFHTHIYTRERR